MPKQIRRKFQVNRSREKKCCSSSSTLLKLLLLAVIVSCTSHVVLMGYKVWSTLDAKGSSHIIGRSSTKLLALEPQRKKIKPGNEGTAKPTTSYAFAKDSNSNSPKVLAIVFPQYHSDPLNDRLWGDGFTDWDNLKAAPKHNRLGFEIPRPTELGYYDLRNATIRRRQGELAKTYGLDGFIYHHYWFYDPSHPGPNLHAPLMEMLKDGYPDVPFLLNWCDSSWVDTWLGKTNASQSSGTGDKVLQTQFFPEETDSVITDHYNWLKQFFRHPNYIKVRGQPVFMIYLRKPSSLPMLKRLRVLAEEDFPGLYYVMGMGFSHAALFPEGESEGQRRDRYPKYLVNKTVAYPNPFDWMESQVLKIPEWCLVDKPSLPEGHRPDEIPGILTSFDNTPRRDLQTAHLWSADQPEVVVKRFYDSLFAAIYYETCCLVEEKTSINKAPTAGNTGEDSFVVINSMNEWAEGMSLEPSNVFGRQFLDAVRRAKFDVLATGCNPKLITNK